MNWIVRESGNGLWVGCIFGFRVNMSDIVILLLEKCFVLIW